MGGPPARDGLLSRALMIPFRLVNPPVLETPLSTIPMPSTYLTVPLVILSFAAMVGGFVFCWVNKAGWYHDSYSETGKPVTEWMVSSRLGDQVLTEAVVVGVIVGLGGLSLIAAYYAITAENKSGIVYDYVYRYAMTFPVWALLSYQIFKMKMPSWDLEFVVSPRQIVGYE